MQRKPFFKLLILGAGYMALGNIMSSVMTIAAAVVAKIPILMALLFIFTVFVFYSLCFTVAFKDGQRERLMVKNHRVDGIIKGRWTSLGILMFLIMSLPSLLLFFDSLFGFIGGYLIPYRMICGMIYPLALLMGVSYPDSIDMPSYFAFIFMACYILIPVVTSLGFSMGYGDKLNPDKILYEKK